MALTGTWQATATLMIAERTGKAIRTPARDVLLSHAAIKVGKGFGFGLHETLDRLRATFWPSPLSQQCFILNLAIAQACQFWLCQLFRADSAVGNSANLS
ncbi:hypothetical protein [Microcoleus sp. bin38.metabat.b11b12b14.051]|uniref:hypothetical protein n=1 Tax=Microcoleus sp. bin38.metabat.b11b12b14.051 TaxID=2742709 RepID=UPI0025F9E02B|nr:hypothetical protein [Microcoleus sp. bin38.metabat.b11b12b14.051]